MFIDESTVVHIKGFLQTNDLGIEALQVGRYMENTLLTVFDKPVWHIPNVETHNCQWRCVPVMQQGWTCRRI